MDHKQQRLTEWSRLAFAWAHHSEKDSFHRKAFEILQGEVIRLAAVVHSTSGALIDVGCGPGVFLRNMCRALPTWRMTGVDFCQKMLDIAERRNCNEPTLIEFLQLDVELPQEQANSPTGHDIATSAFLVDEVEALDVCLLNMSQMVRNGGILVVASLCPTHELERLNEHASSITVHTGTRVLIQKQLEKARDAPHYYRWIRPKADLLLAAKQAGFSLQSDTTLTTAELGCRKGPHLRVTIFNKLA